MSDSTHRAFRVTRVVREGSAGCTLVLDGALPAEPGQFVMAWLPGVEERPYTIMDDDPLSLTVAAVGPFSRSLCALHVGGRLWARGPLGHGFAPAGTRHLLVGGGSGVASLTLLAQRALARGDQVIAAIGARTAGQLMLDWRLAELGAQVIIATDDGSRGYHGTVLEAARAHIERRWPEAVYACGPEPMLRALAQATEAAGLPCFVSLERVMRCGLGVCGNCHCGDRLVCRDGPVFEAALLRP